MLSLRDLKEGKRGGVTANGAVAQWKKRGDIVQVYENNRRNLMLADGRVLSEVFTGRASTAWADYENGVLYRCIYDGALEIYGWVM